MATKTIVCPECQAPAAPGRYACAECGALLASVGLTPRTFGRGDHVAGDAIVPSSVSADDRGDEPDAAPAVATLLGDRPAIVVAPAWTHSLAAEPIESQPSDDERWDDELPADPAASLALDGAAERAAPEIPPSAIEPAPIAVSAALAALVPEVSPPVAARRATSGAKTRMAPAAVMPPAPASPVVEPKRRGIPRPRRQPDPTAIDRIAPLAAPAAPVAAPEWPVVQAEPDAEAAFAARLALAARAGLATAPMAPAEPVEVEPEMIGDEMTADVDVRPVPGWPPPGDLTMTPEPTPRVPAGSYLPPSAVLPPGEALPVVQAANGRGHDPSAAADASPGGSARAAAASRLADLGLPADTPRRVVAIGAAVAALAFLLPWTAGFPGDLLGDYWARWGLAGPGHWIVAGLLVALAVLCLSGGRLASVAVGLPAVAMAALLLGLSWPYLFGFLGRAVGLWVVVAGLVLLVAGGLLELRSSRHDNEGPAV